MARKPAAAPAAPADPAPPRPQGGSMMTPTVAATLLKTTEEEIRDLSKRHVLPPIRGGEMPLVQTVQRYVEHKRDGRRSIHLAGQLIDKSPAWIRSLISDGYIVKQSDGTILERDVFNGYIRWLTDEARRANKVKAESRVRDARAREIELRIAEREGRLAQVSDLEAVLDEYIGSMRSELSGLPAAVTRDLVLRRTIEQAIDERLHRVADAAEQALALLAPGDTSHPAVADPGTGQVGAQQ